MGEDWSRCGPDTLHATFKEGGGRSPMDLAGLLQEFQLERDLPTGQVVRDKGISGFAQAAVDKAAGLRLDWTRPGEEGVNEGFFCLQVKGEWFDQADGETQADFLQLLDAYGVYRVTRIDLQQTIPTRKFLTPWWIRAFENGELKVVGKNVYEPRGKKAGADEYPKGATLYHGSRTSERFSRQYDRHKKANCGPPRRRDEVELKGRTARDCWDELLNDLVEGERQGETRSSRLWAFTKKSIRAYLPIRDTSRWVGRDLPKNWAAMSKEPNSWSALFSEEAKSIQKAPRRVTSMLKSYQYANANFGAAVAAKVCQDILDWELEGYAEWEAMEQAFAGIVLDFVNGANEDRVEEFFQEMPPKNRDHLRTRWMDLVRMGGDKVDIDRDAQAAKSPT